jgi:pantoate--beta-alanine ligase
MQVYKSKSSLIAFIEQEMHLGVSLGFVPTMGALHQGHLSLVKAALVTNKLVVVSIFVNPTQFSSSTDLNKYPRNLEQDIQLLETLSTTSIVVYAPTVEDVYGTHLKVESFDFQGLELPLEGSSRPGHFNGVGTIVKRLFEIVTPNTAYFGEKDFQQLQIIKKMVALAKLPIKIIGCPIEREPNGLAMSSRNRRLNPIELEQSALIYKTLEEVKKKFKFESPEAIREWVAKQFSTHPLLELDYFQISETETLLPITHKDSHKNYRAFIAVFVREVRLIDNIDLN